VLEYRPPVVPAPSNDDRLAQARRFREDFGLPADDPTLQAMASSPDSKYGVPLTRDEEREVDSRDALEEELDAIETYGTQTAQSTYAGLYLDQARGGLVVVGFTGDLETHGEAIEAVFPYPSRLRLVQRDYSKQYLDTVLAKIEADFDSLVADGVDIQSFGATISGNFVEVGVLSVTAALETRFRTAYGPAVRLVQATVEPVAGSAYSSRVGTVGGLVPVGVSSSEGRMADWPVTLPQGAHLRLDEDGGVSFIAADGSSLGAFRSPLATDANGKLLPPLSQSRATRSSSTLTSTPARRSRSSRTTGGTPPGSTPSAPPP